MNTKTLIPNSARTREELAANGRKGGKISGANRRRKREMRDLLTSFLDTKVKLTELPEELIEQLRKAGYKDLTLKERGALLLSYRMSQGDLRAAMLVSKMIGEYSEEIAMQDMEGQEYGEQPIVVTVADAEEVENMRNELAK